MYSRQRTLGRYGRPTQPTVQPYTFPASVGGVNAVDSLMMMPPQDCLYTYNLMPSEYGLRLRKGYREWATGCVEDPQRAENVDVRSIVPFESNVQDASRDRLFAVTAEGIWDVTLFNSNNPVQEVGQAEGWIQTTDPAGYGVWCEFTGDAAGGTGTGLRGHYLFYADGLNGLWQFQEETDLWSRPPSGTGDTDWHYVDGAGDKQPFPVDNIAFVMVHKQRIWVILEDDDDAWYLPVASVNGQLTRFTFGSKLPHGGNLVGLYNWTVDGGDGVDDMLVAISRGGDVIIYQGEDPEITPEGGTPWSTRGAWFIGELPESRRIAVSYGPDMYILSTFGMSSLADLLRGSPVDQQSPSKKINRFLRADVERGKDSSAWQVVIHPGDGFLQVVTPKPTQTPYLQYTLNLQTSAWGFWEGVPVLGSGSWNGDYFMGGEGGVVYINDGTLDATEIAKPNYFQDAPNPAPGPEWSVPDPLEFECDGSQVAQTKYTVDMVDPLIPGTNYTLFYRIKPNTVVNFFQDVPTVPPGPEWSVPVVNEFDCDGTQVAETAYQVDSAQVLKAGVRIEIAFIMTGNTAGQYKLLIGDEEIMVFQGGNGQFSYTYTPASDQATISLIGDADFVGRFTSVSVAYYDGAGYHKVQVGGADVIPEKTGSGAFQAQFTAISADTTLSLVGDADFAGTFYEVQLRVTSDEGAAITFRTLTSFQAPAGHSNFNRVGLIRTIGVLAGVAAINVNAVYDYSVEQQVTPPVTVGNPGQNVWDSAVWDRDLWDFSVEGKSFTQGALGVGRTFAVAVNGNAATRINIVGWDCLFTTGGYL